jgi:hypothetical protein
MRNEKKEKKEKEEDFEEGEKVGQSVRSTPAICLCSGLGPLVSTTKTVPRLFLV